MKPAANSSACCFARAQLRCPSERLSLRPFSRHSIWFTPVLGIGKDPDPVPAPFADAVAPAVSFRACQSFDSSLDDGLTGKDRNRR